MLRFLIFMDVQALLYTQFEDTEGYTVVASDPSSCCKDSQFKDIGYHFLPDRSFASRTISLCLDSIQLLGVPVYIDGKHYLRNTFVFCVILVIRRHQHVSQRYSKLAQLVAKSFRSLEAESRFLSSSAASKLEVMRILKDLRAQINRQQNVFVSVTQHQAIVFKIQPERFALPYAEEIPDNHLVYVTSYASAKSRKQLNLDEFLTSILVLVHGMKSFKELLELIMEKYSNELSRTRAVEIYKYLSFVGVIGHFEGFDDYSRFFLTTKGLTFFSGISERDDASEYCGLTPVEVFRFLKDIDKDILSDLLIKTNKWGIGKRKIEKLIWFALSRGIVRTREARLLVHSSSFGDPDWYRLCDGFTSLAQIIHKTGVTKEKIFKTSSEKLSVIWT
jgi:Nitrogen permease regulator 2